MHKEIMLFGGSSGYGDMACDLSPVGGVYLIDLLTPVENFGPVAAIPRHASWVRPLTRP